MKTRKRRAGRYGVVATGSALALMVAAAAPGNAQVFGPLTIDPAEGPVGTVVTGTVDQAVIDASCSESPEAFMEELIGVAPSYAPVLTEFQASTWGDLPPDPTLDAEYFAYNVLFASLLGISSMPEHGQRAWEQSHVLTFADIATQQPVGGLSTFDPETGVGEVTVPDGLTPGTWAVAATCVHWATELTRADVVSAVEAGTAWVEANLEAPYPSSAYSEEFQAIAVELGSEMFAQRFLVPGEQWVSLFCVHDETGACPGSPPGGGDPGDPPGTGDPTDPGDPADPGDPGTPDPADDGTPPTASPAQPVTGVEPTYTG